MIKFLLLMFAYLCNICIVQATSSDKDNLRALCSYMKENTIHNKLKITYQNNPNLLLEQYFEKTNVNKKIKYHELVLLLPERMHSNEVERKQSKSLFYDDINITINYKYNNLGVFEATYKEALKKNGSLFNIINENKKVSDCFFSNLSEIKSYIEYHNLVTLILAEVESENTSFYSESVNEIAFFETFKDKFIYRKILVNSKNEIVRFRLVLYKGKSGGVAH